MPGARHVRRLFLLITTVSMLVPIDAAGTGKIAATIVIGSAVRGRALRHCMSRPAHRGGRTPLA
ncbi:hypothetical protein [Streptomyces sp. NPDC006463]|uniref:hypothetical protein n=1 Tax=Streptomyces sp. NPDC006463 TaxID=3364746 RepID=UPI0036B7A646